MLATTASFLLAGCKTKENRKELELKPVDARAVCDAMRWSSHTSLKDLYSSEGSELRYAAKNSGMSQEDLAPLLSSLKAAEAEFHDLAIASCMRIPQRVFDCLPYSESSLVGLHGVITSVPHEDAPKDCAVSVDTLLEALSPSAKAGKVKWHTKLSSLPVAVVQDSAGVYVATETLKAFDLEGKSLWSEPVAGVVSLATHAEDVVVFKKDGVVAFDRSSGAKRWNISPPEGARIAAGLLDRDRMYFLAESGKLLAYEFAASCKTPGPCLADEGTLPSLSLKSQYQLLASADGASVIATTDTNAYVLDSTLRLQTMFRGHAQIEWSSFTPSGSLVLGMAGEFILLEPGRCVADKPISLLPSPRLSFLKSKDSPPIPCETCMLPPEECEVARSYVPRSYDVPMEAALAGNTLVSRSGSHLYGLSLDDFSGVWSFRSEPSVQGIISGENGSWYNLSLKGSVAHGGQNGTSDVVTGLPWHSELPALSDEALRWETMGVGSVFDERLALATFSKPSFGSDSYSEFYLTLLGE